MTTRQVIIIISLWVFSSCNTARPRFFDFDEIVYYNFDNYDEHLLKDLWDNKSKSDLDSLKEGVITGDLPKSMADLSFIDKLEQIGFKKNSVDKSKLADIDEIFSVKPADIFLTSCIYVYRDILIFKKNGKVIGVAKICFGCSGNRITGTTANTEFFGQNGDYEKLQKIVRK